MKATETKITLTFPDANNYGIPAGAEFVISQVDPRDISVEAFRAGGSKRFVAEGPHWVESRPGTPEALASAAAAEFPNTVREVRVYERTVEFEPATAGSERYSAPKLISSL